MATSTPSVQAMFNGPGFDLNWLPSKAERKLGIIMNDHSIFMENAANLAVTIAPISDWAFAMEPVAFQPYSNLGQVISYVHSACPEAALFFDINNEYRHWNRDKSSNTAEGVRWYAEQHETNANLSYLCDGTQLFGTGWSAGQRVQYVFTPKIMNGRSGVFVCGARARQ